MTKHLIENCSANFEHRENQERTPLYFACSLGLAHRAIIAYLIERGADVNALTCMRRSCLAKSCWNG